MKELERLEESTKKVEDFQKQYNINSKNIAYLVGKNLTLFVCMLLPLLMIGFIWTEFGNVIFQTKTLVDAVLTVTLFTVGEIMMTRLGTDGGKMDEEYTEAKGVFEEFLQKTLNIGTIFMGVFCDWQIDVELEQAVKTRLRLLKMTNKQFDEIKDYTPSQLKKRYGKRKAKKLQAIIDLEPIELNESILLYNGEYDLRGGVPENGEEYIHEKKHMITTIISCIFTGLLTVTVAVTLTTDITFARVVYTVFKLAMLLFRMAKGYERGAKAYNTIEVKNLKVRTNYLRQYIKFVEEETYLKFKDEYEELKEILGEDEVPEEQIKISEV